MRRISLPAILILGAALVGCRYQKDSSEGFAQVTEEFVFSSLALSPVGATEAGYHQHQGVPLDELLDDYSAPALDNQRKFYHTFHDRLAAIPADKLDAEDRADYDIVNNQIELALVELDTIQAYRHNPTLYVELIGNALFTPFVIEYAPRPERFRHIVKRLQKIPSLLEQAKSNLTDSPEVWNTVARQENDGNIELISKTLREAVPAALSDSYAKAAEPALAALRAFNVFLKDDLASKKSDWRLGKDKYAAKFKCVFSSGKTPEQVLSEAEAELKNARAEIAKLAGGKTVREALDAIAQKHSTRESYLDDARRTLEQATQFVRERALVTLPTRSNLKVIETPVFMRGGYAVGGFSGAPPLEPGLGAFYWVTPIPADWPAARAESKLREYNAYGLQELTIHEAMPGHYVQAEYANQVEPNGRRLLRNVYGNGAYVEGWAVYAQQAMSDAGYMSGDPGLRLTFWKQMLRVITNTILDVRLQTLGMTDKEALDLMTNQAFQETEEATAKLQRAQLSSCQLPTYFVGWKGWLHARDEYKKQRAGEFAALTFHEDALKESAVPLPVLERLLASGAK